MMNDNETRLREALKKASVKLRELVAENDALKRQEPIAVVGLSCRFPGGESPEALWQFLARGGDAVGEIPRTRWDVDRFYDADPDAPGRMYTRQGAFLHDVDAFDAAFFNITPREAEAMDPQQRLLLEVSWAAFEDAALDTRALRGTPTGVFLGLSNYDYIQTHIHSGDAERITPYAGSGVMFSTAAGRLSYFYDLRGPCLTVDTACSSSLVALHLAMESLQRRECDTALAAGVNLLLSPDSFIALCKVKALAADGRSRAFSNDASGYGRGEGCAVLVLKRLSDAQRDGDRIMAVLRGAAVNHDGRSNGLTAPNGVAQQGVIRKALATAGVDAASVQYVETHGTGTILGDPIELNALASIFRHPLLVGSVKTNIGHTEAAAGLAGVIKVILAMRHGALPPSIHRGTPNRHLDWSALPLRVVGTLEEWPSGDAPRIAGVSSFGLSGTNAHVVIEEAPRTEPAAREHDRAVHLLPLSAATPEALEEVAAGYVRTLEEEVDLGDVCHTAASRSHLPVRMAVIAPTREAMREVLTEADRRRPRRLPVAASRRHSAGETPAQAAGGTPAVRRKAGVAAKRGVVFLFPGDELTRSVWTAAAPAAALEAPAAAGAAAFESASCARAVQNEPVFRAALERCAALPGVTPPLFALQVALTELWKSWGVEPAAVAGEGVGASAAAYAAGKLTLEEAARRSVAEGGPPIAAAIEALARNGHDLFLELGPGDTLTRSIPEQHVAVSSLPDILHAVAELYVHEQTIDWRAFDAPYRHRRLPLPTYPFQRKRYWLDLAPVRKDTAMNQHATGGAADHIVSILSGITGLAAEAIDRRQHLMEMGLDSLMLLAMGQKVEKEYGLTLQVSQFFQELSTIEDLARYVEQHGRTSAAPAVPEVVPADLPRSAVQAPPLTDLFERQLHYYSLLCQQQLAAEWRTGNPACPDREDRQDRQDRQDCLSSTSTASKTNFRALNLQPPKPLTPEQRAFVDGVVARHVERTRGSKQLTQEYRDVLADWKHTLSFWTQFKEAKYPIVSARSAGPRFHDVDGNEYIDLAIGMGVNFFGHRAPFLDAALRRQLDEGLELGTQSDLTGKVARLFHELTGCERVTFSNTGTEAVMVAIRLARAATKRTRIVLFRDSYHGIFDGVLAAEEDGKVVPVGLGTPQSMIDGVVILEYGADESLDAIAGLDDLAAVLVEPVQSRNPDLQPQRFLKKLRALTRERGVALIFDEMITGFRIHPGGAQAWFGIDADIAVYGKIAGGGLPIGVIAGKPKFLDYIDGGHWEYGDRSGPRSEMIYFGGTFGRNPATMATAHAALEWLQAAGPELQAAVNGRTTRFCDALNWFFEREQVPLRVKHFASQWRLVPLGEGDHAQPIELELLWLLLMARGVYTWERRICFFSTEHGDAEVAYVLDAIRESIAAIRAGGFPFRTEVYEPRQFAAPSSTQRRMYALAQRPGGQLPYHLPQSLRIDGPLDVDRLEDCFREVIARHESLRTSFVVIDGELLLRTTAEPRFTIERHECDESQVDERARALLQPFDLSAAPLMRVAVIRTGPERYQLFADAHHIVADGLSFNVIAAEIMALYEGTALPPVTYDFRECLALEEAASENDEAFWRAQLAGELPVLALPADHPRPAERDFRGDHVLGVIDAATTQRLRELGLTTRTSLYMLLLAAYDVLLHRLTLQDDLLVGGVVSGRRDARRAQAVGMFVNTVVFRTRLDGRTPFRELLDAVRRNCLEVYDHQDFPFEQMARLNDTRPHDRNALFDTLLSYENATDRAFRIRDLRFTNEPFRAPASMFDLSLEVIEEEGALHLDFAYATSLFSRASIIRWYGYFSRILFAILEDPDRPIGDIDLVGDDERALVAAFNDTGAAYPALDSLIDLFDAQVARTPDRIAVVFGECELTYRELHARAAHASETLRRDYDLERGDFAGILLQRSEHTIIAILAILGAGAAYVPLDPDHPAERTAFMIEDSGCRLVLTSEETASRLSDDLAGLAVDLEAILGPHDGITAPAPLSGRPQPDDVAYVIYTSGSTGRPKGCLVTHRNVVRLMINSRHDFDFNESDVWTIAHSFCFDFSVWEMYGALLYGGRTIVVPTEVVRDAHAFRALVARHRVTVLNQTPAAFLSFVAAERAATEHKLDEHLRYVVFGGDRLEPISLRDWTALYPLDRIALVNMYGITETTVHVTYYRLRDCDVHGPAGRSIVGRPIPETTVYVCDERMRQQPLGVPGELYVGGTGVSAGYRNRPELTAERFLASPFRAGERLYRTGDVGCLLPDGTLEHRGRNDHQVQIRGYRVELGEVTQRLLEHPRIGEALVVDRDGANGTRQLVAYFVAGETLDADALRDHLARSLPSYMIPSHFVPLPSLPLTPNGKVDRKALPPVDATAVATGTSYVPPRNDVEATIVRIWEEVLQRRPIGIHDDFFSHGGDSIVALRIAGRLHEAGLAMELRHLFEARTVAALAPRVVRAEARAAGRSSTSSTPIQRWFFETHTDRHHFNQSVLLRAHERIDEAALRRALDALAARHELLRYSLEVVESGDLVPHAERVQASFDLERGPLFRAVVHRAQDGDRLLLVAHHLIIDGVSWRIVLDDLASAYAGRELHPPSDAYAQWAAVLEDYARGAEVQSEIPYWHAVESVPALSIPPDFDWPVNRYGDAAAVESALDAETTELLLTRVHAVEQTEIRDVLLTALARAARREHGVAGMRLLLEGHGREELAPGRDFTETVGWFTSLYPVALALSEGGALRDDLRRVRDSLRAIPRNGIGYGVLRWLARVPFRELPEVIFNYLGQFDNGAGGPWSLSDEPCGRAHGAALERGALVELETAVIGGRLRIAASYNRRIHDRATIARFVEAFRDELLQLAALAVAPAEEELPLTMLQEGMLFHALEGRSAYFEQFTYRITGELDVERFFAAWRALARRHTVLRTAIRADGGRPRQVVLRDRTVETKFVRTTADHVARIAEADRARGFDLANDPLMRVLVLQTGEREYEVVWSHHHVILDGWSVGILQEELTALYDDPAAALPPDAGGGQAILPVRTGRIACPPQGAALPPAPQYREFLDWLASRDQTPSRRFWSSLLDSPPAPSSVPDLVRADAYVPAEHVFRFDRATTAALGDLASRLGTTLSSAFQALWSVLLAMYSGEPDVIFGAVVSGRPPELRGVERMAGLFLQTIPVRVRVDREATFAALAAAVQETALASAPHHHYPLTEMQLLTGVARPLFNHVLVFENYPFDGARPPRGLHIDRVRAHEQMHYDFSVVIHPREELEVTFAVNANAIPQARLSIMEEQLRTLVAAVLRDGQTRIGDLDLHAETVVEVVPPPQGNVLDLFEAQVRATPNALAVEQDGERLNYAELDARAEALARTMDVRAGEIVPILLPASLDYVVTILAVMKRRGVFAPIAPDQPESRIAALRERLTGTLDAGAAYVLFTSGSTGEPKAIVGTHEGLHHFIAWERDELRADASIRASNLAQPTFDVSLRDIFLPLVCGGTVCIPPAAAREDAARLLRWLADARVTHVHIVPSIFRLLTRDSGERLPGLRCLLFAGEPLYGRDVQRARSLFGDDVALINLYGPSETTLAKAFYRVPETFDDPARMVPIGTPIAGTRITLRKDGRPVARGAIGELHIEPPFRCAGYLDGGNADAFDGNVYRTGDLGRELADGTLEFIGRRDRQVKVNGIRIELAEIDRALLAQPEIDLAVAVAIAQPDGDQALAAYYTEKAPIDGATLRTRLRATLPDWMIPAWLIRLEELPLNANGKIDRAALPKPEELASGRIRYEAPANELEARIAAIWAEALGVPRVGVVSPFFEIGGNSLRAIRIIGRVNRELGTSLTIRGFFAHPTVRDLAASLGGAIAPLPRAEHYAVSHAQRRLWVLDQLGVQPGAYVLPAAFLLEGALDVAALQRAFGALVARHESLRTTFVTVDGEPRQRIHDDVAFVVPLLTSPTDEDARDTARLWVAQPFDLTTGPLFRAAIIRIRDDRHLLVAALHHIISDGWSIATMTTELAELVRGVARPPLRIHYKDFSAFQNALIDSEAGRRARDYWHRRLATPLPALPLPFDHPRPAVQSFRGGTVLHTIDAALAADVRRFSSAGGGTLFMTLVAALHALLYRYTGQHDVIAGTAVSNRDGEELDGQLGFYVNMLALRQEVRGDETFAALFAKVRDTVAGAVEHALYPFDRLVQELDIPRDLGRTPVFDVTIVLQDGVQPALDLPGVRVSSLDLDWHTAKYTLSFELTEQRDGSIELSLGFDADLFERETIERLGRHFTTLLASATRSPALPVDELELLSPAERAVLLPAAPASSNESETIVTRFERVAAAHAGRPAVVCEERLLTYDELNRRANRLAYALESICGRGDFVAVILERTELLIVAFLGILKRGAVYVPIDPTYPAERIQHMLDDCGATVVLGRGGLDVETLGDCQNDSNPPPAAGPRDLAYVIYTSGSTGRPKGVLLEHDGAVSLSEAHGAIGIEARHRILQFAPSSFDASVWEMLMALMHGAALVIATPQRIADTSRLAAYLREHAVTVATLPPSYLAQLGNDAVEPLEILFTAGEPPSLEQALVLGRKLRYLNAYGPTEATVCATWHEVDPARRYDGTIPIGRAIPGAAVYVLDARRNPVPFGVTGEIYIGGRGVARGYHGRPDLTAQSFVDGLYRSGDLGSVRPDGELVYLGRNDAQVKIRGHRVELGEIEQTLLQCPGVRQAAVVARGDGGTNELVAYVAPAEVDVAALRARLEPSLPPVMIPARWIRLHALPLMPNGKIDRAGLPQDSDGAGPAPVAPRNDLERSIAEAWQDVLRREAIGIHDRFYEAGGDSIKAIRIVNRLRRDGLDVRVADFLAAPTIAGLAAQLSLRDDDTPPVPSLSFHGAGVPLTAGELETLFNE